MQRSKVGDCGEVYQISSRNKSIYLWLNDVFLQDVVHVLNEENMLYEALNVNNETNMF